MFSLMCVCVCVMRCLLISALQYFRKDKDSWQYGLHFAALHPYGHFSESSNGTGSFLLHHDGNHLVHQQYVRLHNGLMQKTH